MATDSPTFPPPQTTDGSSPPSDTASTSSTTAAAAAVPMFQPGDIIFEDLAYVSVLNDEERGKRCDFCFRCPDRSLLAGPLGACAKCKFVHYCSKECQKGDWPAHKTECKRILSLPENLREKLANAMVRLMARIVDRDVRGDNLSVKSSCYKRCFDDLEPHVEELRQQPERMQRLQIIVEALKYFLRVPDPLLLLKYDDVFFTRVFGRIAVNSYGVTDELGSSDIGTAIYLDASRLDHSCKPNAVTSFHGTAAHIRALEPIPKAFLDLGPKKQLSRIRTTYSVVDLLQLASTKKRKEKLKKKYLFECDCQWCNEDDLSFLGRCPECEGLVQPGGESGFVPCEQCGYSLSVDEKTLIKQIVVESLIEHEKIARLMEKEEYKDCLDRCHALMLKQDQVFHQANRLSLKTIIKVFTCAYTVLPISLTEEDPVDIDRRLEHLIEMMANYGQLLTQTLAHPLLASLKTFFTEFYLATAASQQKMGLHSEAIDTLNDLLEAVCRGRGPQSSFATLVRAYKSECEAKRLAADGNRDAGLEIITDALREMSKVFSRQHPQWKRMQELQYELEMPDLLTGGGGSSGSGGRSGGGSSINNDNNNSSLDASDDSSLSTNGDDLPLAIIHQGEDLAKTPATQSSVPLRKILEGIPSKLSEAEISSSDDLLDEKPATNHLKKRGGKKGPAKQLTVPGGGGGGGDVEVNLRSPARNEECDSMTSEGSEVRMSLYEAEKNKLRNKKKKKKERKQSEELMLQKGDEKKEDDAATTSATAVEAAPTETTEGTHEMGVTEAKQREENKERERNEQREESEQRVEVSPVPSVSAEHPATDATTQETKDSHSRPLKTKEQGADQDSKEKKAKEIVVSKVNDEEIPTRIVAPAAQVSPSENADKTADTKEAPSPKTSTSKSSTRNTPAAKAVTKTSTPPPPPRPKERPIVPIKPISAKPAAMSWARIVAKTGPTNVAPSTNTIHSPTNSTPATPATNDKTATPTSGNAKTPTEVLTPVSSTESIAAQESTVQTTDDTIPIVAAAITPKASPFGASNPAASTTAIATPAASTPLATATKSAEEAKTSRDKRKEENKNHNNNNNNNQPGNEKKPKTPRAKSKGRNKRSKAQKAAASSATETALATSAAPSTPTDQTSPPTENPKETTDEDDKKESTSTPTTTTQTKEEMEARVTSLLVKKSDDDDSDMSDKEKAGIAWRILQFCLASRIQKVKVPQDTHILQEPPGPDKAKTLQKQFVSKMAAAAATTAGEAATEDTKEAEAEEEKEAEEKEEKPVEEITATTAEEAPPPPIPTEVTAEEKQPDERDGKKAKERKPSSKSASQSRSRTPSICNDKSAGNNKNKKKAKGANKKGAEEDNLDDLIAEVMKMDAEKSAAAMAETENSHSGSKRSSSSRSSSRAKEISAATAPSPQPTAEAPAPSPQPTAAAAAATSTPSAPSISEEQNDYTEVKTNYDNMFEEFETDILLSMEEMQTMGATSNHMEERLNAVQSKSSNQSHRFRAVKESYKAMGTDLENRLKKMVEKRSKEEAKEAPGAEKGEEEEEEEKADATEEEEKEKGIPEETDSTFPEDELQNALMSSLEGKTTSSSLKDEKSPPSLHSPAEDESELTDKDAELTDKGYTLTDDGVSDDPDVFGGALGKIAGGMSASMIVASTTRGTSESEDAMTASTISWGDTLDKDESTTRESQPEKGDELVERPPPNGAVTTTVDGLKDEPPRTYGRQVSAGVNVSEDSGLSDSKTSELYDPYKGKKKRKQRPRVKSMIEI